MMNGYKTLIWNVFKIASGAAIAAGVMTPEQQHLITSNADSIIGGTLVIISIGDLILRKVTTGPMGKLFK